MSFNPCIFIYRLTINKHFPCILSHYSCNMSDKCRLSGSVWAYKPIVSSFVTSPPEIMFPEDPSRTDMQYFKLRFALMDRDVSYLSTMIITVLESMMHYLEDNWEMLCDDIEHGTINESIACPPQVKEKLMKRIKPMPGRAAELRSEIE